MKNLLFQTTLWIVGAIVAFWLLLSVLEIELAQSASIVVLAATGLAIFIQAVATKEMADNQVRPAVDVSMIFNEGDQGTCFQFINVSKVPACVWVKIDLSINGDNKNDLVEGEYLNGREDKHIDVGTRKYITSSGFLKKLTPYYKKEENKIKVVLHVDVAPLFNKKSRSFFQKKEYEFDGKEKTWKHMPFWGIPDKIDPELLKKLKN